MGACVRRRIVLAAAVANVLCGSGTLSAASAVWDGDAVVGTQGDNINWNSAANWTTGGVADSAPSDTAPGDDLTFGNGTAGGIIDLGAARVANSLTFNKNYTLGVAATALVLTNTSGNVSVSSGTTGTINAVLAGGGGINLSSGGTLVLNRTGNTFTGNIVVDGSTLAVVGVTGSADQTALGAAGGRSVTLQNGATFSLIGSNSFNPTSSTKSLVIGTGGGTIDVASGLTVQLDDAGQFSGTGALTKTGAGILFINNQSFTYTGSSININAGTLRVGANAGVLGATNVPITVADGATYDVLFALSGNKPVTVKGAGVGGNGALIASSGTAGDINGAVTLTGDTTVGGAGVLTISGAISDGGGNFNLSKVGAGTVVLSAATNTWGGNTTISGGALRGAPGTSLPTTGNVVLNGGALEPSTNYAANLGIGAGQVQFTAGAAGGFSGGAAAGVTVTINGGTQLVWGSTPNFNPSALIVSQTNAVGTMTLTNAIDLNGATRTFTGNGTFDGIVGGVISNSGAAGVGVTINGTGVTQFAAVNTYDGTTTLAGGTLSIAADNNIPTGGPITFNGGVLRVTGSALSNFGSHTATFTNNAAAGIDVADPAHTFTISQDVNIGTGGFTKAGAGTLNFASGATLTASGTLTISGGGVLNLNQSADLVIANAATINGTGGTLNITGGGKLKVNTAGTDIGTSGTLTINADIANGTASSIDFFNSGSGTVVLTGNNTWTGVTNIQNAIVSVSSINRVSGGSASSNLGAPSSVANGVISIGSSATSTLRYTGTGETTDRRINLAGTTNGAVLDQSGTGLLKFTTDFTATGAGSKTLTLTGSTAGTGEISGVIVNNSSTNTTAVNKTGTGTWTLSGANTYTGTTTISSGRLVVGATNTLPTGGLVNMGAGSTAGTLDVNSFSQSLSRLAVASTGNVTNGIEIGAGQTLTITGNATAGTVAFSAGNSSTAGAINRLAISGQGELVINSPLANTNTWVMTNTNNSTATQSLDMSALATLTATVGTIAVGDGGGKPVSELTLANSNTITTTTLRFANGTGSATSGSFLKLGQTNIINANTIAIANGRQDADVLFRSGLTGTPTLKIRSATDPVNGRADMALGNNSSSFTGAAGGSSSPNADVDFTGGSVDILLNNLVLGIMGSQASNNAGHGIGSLTFNAGTIDATTVIIGQALDVTGGTSDPSNATHGTINVNGGTFHAGSIAIAQNKDGSTGLNSKITGVLNIAGGVTTVTGGINVADHTSTSTGLSTGTINLTGGSLAVGGDIVDGSATTNISTLKLDGGDLNLASHLIKVDTFDLRSGTLRNLSQFNSGATTGAALTKTSTGVLTLSGNNTYTGDTVINGGKLLANSPSPNSATGSGSVTVNDTGTLGGSGNIAGAVTINTGGTLAPGNSIGTLSIASPLTLGTGGTSSAPTYATELAANGTSDLVALTGSGSSGLLTLDNPDTLNLLPIDNITSQTTYTIATFASESGVFDNVLVNGVASQNVNPAGANYVLVTYNPTNIQVTVNNLSAVPEPATAALLGLTASGLLLRRRRRFCRMPPS